jgi:hypothetical protein
VGVIALATVPAILTPAAGNADPSSDVLAQEERWLTAITAGDVATVESILAPDYMHITSQGQLLDRAQEISALAPQKFVMNPSEELVDFAADTAVVRGINTVTEGDKVLARERFTDVFVLQNGTWMALSAQETAI